MVTCIRLCWKFINKLVLYPEHPFRIFWDMLLLLTLLYLAISVPLFISFALSSQAVWGDMDLLITIIFILDIALNFSTGFYHKGNLNMDRRSIARNYVKFWFWIDFFSTVPYDWLIDGLVNDKVSTSDSNSGNTSSMIKMLKFFRIFRFFRLLRIAKLRMLLIKVEENFLSKSAATFINLVKIASCIFIVSHWFACILYLVAIQDLDSTMNNWITTYELKYNQQQLDLTNAYISALYWAFTTMAGIGYGDIVPVTSSERILGMFCMMITSAIFGYIVGDISSIISKRSAKSSKKSETLIAINAFLKKNGFPKEFSMKIRRYLDFVFENQCDDIQDNHLLSILSLRLREEIYNFINGNILKSCSIILQYHENFISQLAKSAHTKLYAPSDIVFQEGEKGNIIYFIQAGNVCVYNESSNYELATLKENKYFGEISFFSNRLRTASTKCKTFVEILTISKIDFLNLEENYSEAKETSIKLEVETKDGDYTILGVTCYLCNKLGHAAIDCTKRIYKLDQERSKKFWIMSRNRTKLINPYMSQIEISRERPKVIPRWGMMNITSRVRATNQYSTDLNQKINEFNERKDLEKVYLGLQRKDTKKKYSSKLKDSINPIVEEDEESLESDNMSKRSVMKFDNVNLTVTPRYPKFSNFSQAADSYARNTQESPPDASLRLPYVDTKQKTSVEIILEKFDKEEDQDYEEDQYYEEDQDYEEDQYYEEDQDIEEDE